MAFTFLFNRLGVAKSVKGNVYGTGVEFDNGLSQWIDSEPYECEEIYTHGFKVAVK